MAIYSEFSHKNGEMFHSYVSPFTRGYPVYGHVFGIHDDGGTPAEACPHVLGPCNSWSIPSRVPKSVHFHDLPCMATDETTNATLW